MRCTVPPASPNEERLRGDVLTPCGGPNVNRPEPAIPRTAARADAAPYRERHSAGLGVVGPHVFGPYRALLPLVGARPMRRSVRQLSAAEALFCAARYGRVAIRPTHIAISGLK